MVFVFTPANTNPMQLSISIVDDALLESDETFQVELTVNSALATAVAPSLSPVTIRDNEGSYVCANYYLSLLLIQIIT